MYNAEKDEKDKQDKKQRTLLKIEKGKKSAAKIGLHFLETLLKPCYVDVWIRYLLLFC